MPFKICKQAVESTSCLTDIPTGESQKDSVCVASSFHRKSLLTDLARKPLWICGWCLFSYKVHWKEKSPEPLGSHCGEIRSP